MPSRSRRSPSPSSPQKFCKHKVCDQQPLDKHKCKHAPRCKSILATHSSWKGHVNDYHADDVDIKDKEKGLSPASLNNKKFTPSVFAGLSMKLRRKDPFSPLACSAPDCSKTFVSRKEASKHVKSTHFGYASQQSSSSRPVTLYPEEDNPPSAAEDLPAENDHLAAVEDNPPADPPADEDDPPADAPLHHENELVPVSAPLDNDHVNGNEVPLPAEDSDDDEVVLSVFTTRPRLGRAAPPPLITPARISPTPPIATVVQQRRVLTPARISPTPPIATVVQQRRVPTPPNMDPVTIQPNIDALRALEAVKAGLKCPM